MSVISSQLLPHSGFFACCALKLTHIVDFINYNEKMPDLVDSSQHFNWYKNENETKDITYEYFEHYDERDNIITIPSGDENRASYFTDPLPGINKKIIIVDNDVITEYDEFVTIKLNTTNKPTIKIYYGVIFDYAIDVTNICMEMTNTHPTHYVHTEQFTDYSNVDYKHITPLISKYFHPAKNINDIINNIEKKYNLTYENICVLFYRGNDKITETELCKYDEYLKYANEIMIKNPNISFLIQSDETEFIEFMTIKFPNNSFYFKDEIRHMKKCNSTVDIEMRSEIKEFSKKYLAITIIMSKCKYIICGSGNCSMWILLYRGNNENVIQNLNGHWYRTINLF